MIVDYVDAHKETFGVEPICAALQVAPSTYYAHRSRPPSPRSVTDAATTVKIAETHAANYGVYGARKVHAELVRTGHPVARCTVERLMRRAGLRGITRAKGPRTTIPGDGPDHRPDLVDRQFIAAGPNQLWVADITYIRTFSGWVYAAFVTDVFSRRVVGWQLSRSLRTDPFARRGAADRITPRVQRHPYRSLPKLLRVLSWCCHDSHPLGECEPPSDPGRDNEQISTSPTSPAREISVGRYLCP